MTDENRRETIQADRDLFASQHYVATHIFQFEFSYVVTKRDRKKALVRGGDGAEALHTGATVAMPAQLRADEEPRAGPTINWTAAPEFCRDAVTEPKAKSPMNKA
ncbi:hypothetical protein HHL25_20870 [Rhizobium sp. S-51]|uniref:Uncharacterized protein n=1 Tax=Rhizobium terricola TaxID=2728849 RepID=A0A7Y0AZX0_9HYPH|nr:hypothetical protein [Rhizobium terricola]NML76593.1 hypothetical protein [Rhizobium terricola]